MVNRLYNICRCSNGGAASYRADTAGGGEKLEGMDFPLVLPESYLRACGGLGGAGSLGEGPLLPSCSSGFSGLVCMSLCVCVCVCVRVSLPGRLRANDPGFPGRAGFGGQAGCWAPLDLFSRKKSPGSCVMSAAQQPALSRCPAAGSLQVQDQLASDTRSAMPASGPGVKNQSFHILATFCTCSYYGFSCTDASCSLVAP